MRMNLGKLSLTELNAALQQIEQRKTQLEKNQAKELRAKIDGLLEKSGLTLGDVYPRLGNRSAAPTKAGSKKTGRRRAKAGRGRKSAKPPKYRNPADPTQTWSGYGRRPQWFVDAQKRGQEKSLLIRGAAR